MKIFRDNPDCLSAANILGLLYEYKGITIDFKTIQGVKIFYLLRKRLDPTHVSFANLKKLLVLKKNMITRTIVLIFCFILLKI